MNGHTPAVDECRLFCFMTDKVVKRVAHGIDNGPMEGFGGILKRERYYGKRFTSKKELTNMISVILPTTTVTVFNEISVY